MKLRNKKTGEIKELKDIMSDMIDNHIVPTLIAIENEWEDVEEPKEYWYIDDAGVIQIDQVLSSEINMRKSIGNYFETKEEAEKAVEKLKAWKRLKDKGFKFIGVRGIGKVIDFDMPKPYHHVAFDEYNANENELEFFNDLMLLFGCKE